MPTRIVARLLGVRREYERDIERADTGEDERLEQARRIHQDAQRRLARVEIRVALARRLAQR